MDGAPAILAQRDLDFCELELTLRWSQADSYLASLRFTQPRDDADIRLTDPAPIEIDRKRLAALRANATKYGEALSAMLFGNEQIRSVFGKARAVAQANDYALRLRLFIGNNAPELHELWWETIADPIDQGLLLAREDIVFSRYLDSSDWRPVTPARRRSLDALVVVANPKDLDQYAPAGHPLAPVQVAAELDAARVGLGAINLVPVATQGSATLDGIVAKLRTGYDILYLVCHGALIEGEPRLYLENEDGNAAVVRGTDLVVRLREMRERPRLIVLASCQSAGAGAEASADDGGALAALGPRLAETGIPAVLAMQGNISMASVARFMPVFFAEIERHGQIDRAMAVARGTIRERPDWWMPVLFMRLKSGMLWYERGFVSDADRDYPNWDGLFADIDQGRSVLVLGPSLGEKLLGSTRDIARGWADKYAFPMAPQEREDLPQVSQYLAYSRNADFPLDQLRTHLKHEIIRRYRDLLPEAMRDPANPRLRVDQLVLEVGRRLRADQPRDAHRMLASLPITTFVTTNRENLLEDALRDVGRAPEVVICRWRELDESQASEWPKSVFDSEPDFQPSVERPLLFHVFGNMRHPDSVVLTEDDHFDFLGGVTRNQANPNTGIPPMVRRALAANGLVFLGFHVDDWDFRILFRGILRQQGSNASRRRANVAVQIEPSEGKMLEPRGARNYLQKYFLTNRAIATYWGTYEDFLQEFVERWSKR